jgi:hypothetical protein
MVNALARPGDRMLRGVLPAAGAQACSYAWTSCYDVTCSSGAECWGCRKNTCGQYTCALDYDGDLFGCSN